MHPGYFLCNGTRQLLHAVNDTVVTVKTFSVGWTVVSLVSEHFESFRTKHFAHLFFFLIVA